jgi:SRSO17 transposase
MRQTDVDALAARTQKFTGHIGEALGSKPRRERLAEYAQGKLLLGERKSIEPMAARLDPEDAMSRHNALPAIISVSDWRDDRVRRAALSWAEPAITASGPVRVWSLDDTGFIKQGKHSVSVQRQHTETAGKTCNWLAFAS